MPHAVLWASAREHPPVEGVEGLGTANMVGKGLRQVVRPLVRGMFDVWRVNLDVRRNS